MWSDTLDTIVGPYQSIKCWRQHLKEKAPEEILERYGADNLLMAGGVVLGKLTRFTYYSDMKLQLEAAQMAAALLFACFSCSISHPQRHVDHGTYQPLELWESKDFFMDQYKCNAHGLTVGAEAIAAILVENKMYLEALPVLSIHENLAYHVLRDLQGCVQSRVLRCRALCGMGMMQECCEVLWMLTHGRRLPDSMSQNDLVLRDAGGTPIKASPALRFSNGSPPGHPNNKEALKFFGETELPTHLVALYGETVAHQVNCCRASLLMEAAKEPQWWQNVDPVTGCAIESPCECIRPYLLERAVAILEETAQKAESSLKREDEPVMASATIVCHSRMLLAKAECQRWGYFEALQHLQGLLVTIEENAERVASTVSTIEPDEAHKVLLPQGMWLSARLQMLHIFIKLGHASACRKVLASAEVDAKAINSFLAKAEIKFIRASLSLLQGNLSDAIEKYEQCIVQHEELGIEDPRVASVVMICGDAYQHLGLNKEATRLYSKTVDSMRAWCNSIGLKEMQVHSASSATKHGASVFLDIFRSDLQAGPELKSLYLVGLPLLADAMLRLGSQKNLASEFHDASLILRDAYSNVLPFTMANPAVHVTIATELGAALGKYEKSCGLTIPKTEGNHPEKDSPDVWNQLAIDIAIVDGDHDWAAVKAAVIHQTKVEIHRGNSKKACGLVKIALQVTDKHETIARYPQVLEGISPQTIPAWSATLLRATEQWNAQKMEFGARPDLKDQDLSIMAVRSYSSLVSFKKPASILNERQQQAERIAFHKTLREGCASYKEKCCFENPPKLSDAEAEMDEPAAACIIWNAKIDEEAVRESFEPTAARVEMIYVILNENEGGEGVDFRGCRECRLEDVRALHHKIKEAAKSTVSDSAINGITSDLASCLNLPQDSPVPPVTPEIFPQLVEAFDVSRGIADFGVTPFVEWLAKVAVLW
ncbi:hypothetical protein BSKO_03344 [Bryopsis sp. KO-2023]|nr:hypothetical protein BSKO_03344 [Bryopsis sp. KO-2023]